MTISSTAQKNNVELQAIDILNSNFSRYSDWSVRFGHLHDRTKAQRNRNQKSFRPKQQRTAKYFRLKPALITAGMLLCFFVVFGLLREILYPGRMSSDKFFEEIQQMSQSLDSELEWDPQKAVAKAFDGPFCLETWDSPKMAGVYAVMHRTSQENKQNTFVVDYCGHSRNLSLYKGYPWLHQRKKKLIARIGSMQNVYIAVFILPDSSRYERQRVKQAMVKAFNPYFNKGV